MCYLVSYSKSFKALASQKGIKSVKKI